MHSPTDDLRDLRAILASRTLSSRARMVAVVLLSYRRGSDGRCDPGVERIAADAGSDARTVRRALVELVEAGVLECEYRRGRSTQYTIQAPTSATESLVPESHQSDRGTAPLEAGSPQGQSDTEPLANMSGVTETQEVHFCQDTPGISVQKPLAFLSPKRTKNERKNERSEIVERLWAAYTESMNGSGQQLTKLRRQKLENLFDEHLAAAPDPLALFGAIMAAVKADPWKMKNRAFQKVESLFLNPERRETRVIEGRERLNGHQPNGKPRNPMYMTPQEIMEWSAR
jgi:DNA-binding transcriptional ArsR family regulator